MSRVSGPGTAQKRSSSNGRHTNVLAERSRNTMTPSKSRLGTAKGAFTTPKRMSVAPSGRPSVAGTASKRMSGRGSHMGARAVKDTRPLTDKEYQKEQVRNFIVIYQDK